MADIPKLSPITTPVRGLQGIAAAVSRVAQRADTSLCIKTDRNLKAQTIPGVGQTLSYEGPNPDFQWQLYVIVTAGPAAEADYTDNRYWVAPAFLLQADADTDTTVANPKIEDGDAADEIVTATNLDEAVSGSHSLMPGTFVWIRQMRGRSTSGTTNLQWIMNKGANPKQHAKITAKSAINGGIRYKYTIELGRWDMSTSPSTGGTWVTTSTGTLYAYNSAEDMNTYTSGTGAIGTGNTTVTQSDGTINGGACKLVPLPVNGYVFVEFRGVDSATGQKYYTITNMANSAQ